MDICESILERKRHDSERSACSILEQNDIEAVEALVCMSSWGQRSQKSDLLKIRPLTPVSDSGDVTTTVHVDEATPELQKDFHSLSMLVRGGGEECLCAVASVPSINVLVDALGCWQASSWPPPVENQRVKLCFIFWKHIFSIDPS